MSRPQFDDASRCGSSTVPNNSKEYNRCSACEFCEHCLPIGEGDHWCAVIEQLVLDNYHPTSDYYSCEGKAFQKR